MKSIRCLPAIRAMAALIFACIGVDAVAQQPDTNPPTLGITHSWIRKEGGFYVFRMMLDPQDNKGIDRIEYREKINTTSIPATMAWSKAIQNGINLYGTPWMVNKPFELAFNCTSLVVQFRAVDTSGNLSPVITRTFKSPFPLSNAPNFDPKVSVTTQIAGAPTLECKGLFTADFDGNGLQDIAVLDRTTGLVKVRRNMGGITTSNGFSLTANTIEDGACADLNGDGRPDLAVCHNGGFTLYRNDGLNGSGVLQFSDQTPSAVAQASSGLSSVHRVAGGDVSGDGRPDLILAGDSDDGMGGTVARVVVFQANAGGGFNAPPQGYTFPSGKEAGRMAIGDLNGDGFVDIVTISPVSKQLIVLLNKGGGYFGEFADADTTKRPVQLSTGGSGLPTIPANAVAVGDVTGDGLADIVTVLHAWLPDNDNPSLNKNVQLWQFFDQLQNGTMHRNPAELISEAPTTVPQQSYSSDVILQKLSGDRIPEMVFTSQFGGGLRVVRLVSFLNDQNQMVGYEFSTLDTATASNPHRLTALEIPGSSGVEVYCANTNANQLTRVIFYPGTAVVKPLTLACGASTMSDPNGTADSKGVYSYWEFAGGTVSFTLAYANNSANNLTGVKIECSLPKQLEVVSGDADYQIVKVGTTNYIRWTQDISAGSSGVKQFSAKIISGSDNYKIKATGYLRSGSTTITQAMPVIVVEEPLQVTLTVSTDSDPTGARAHTEEVITYKMKIKNWSPSALTGLEAVVVVPTNTTYNGRSPDDVLGPATVERVAGRDRAVWWKNFTLASNEEKEVFVNVKVNRTVAVGTEIKLSGTGARRVGSGSALVPVFTTKIEPSLEIKLVADKTTVRPGELINYTLTAKNWASFEIRDAMVVDLIPDGTFLVQADTQGGNGDFDDSPLMGPNMTPTTNPGYDSKYRTLRWLLGNLAPGEDRDMHFRVQVLHDLPTYYYLKPNVSTTNTVLNSRYNLSGRSSVSGSLLFAGAALSPSLAAKPNALPYWSLSSKLPPKQANLTPLPALPRPDISFSMTVSERDGRINEHTFSTIEPGGGGLGYFAYKHTAANTGNDVARNVVIHDYLPEGAEFLGHIKRNDVYVASYFGFHFYDFQGREIPGGGEDFTDTNSNSRRDAGEPYVDANRNGKYDGLSAIRMIDFPVGDLAAGQTVTFSYRCSTPKLPPFKMISRSSSGTASMTYAAIATNKGIHLTAGNLRFPVAATPKALTVQVIKPAQLLVHNPLRSRGEFTAVGDIAEYWIPYEVIGGQGLTMSGVKIEADIPNGYNLSSAVLLDANGNPRTAMTGETTGVAPARDSKGNLKVTWTLGSMPAGLTGIVGLSVSAASASVLVDSKTGFAKAPFATRPVISGGFLSASPAPLARASRASGSPSVSMLPSYSSLGLTGLLFQNDAKVFVGCSAPVSVKPGQRFKYTIFVGNLHHNNLGESKIQMAVPIGTKLITPLARYTFNSPGFSGTAPYGPTTSGRDEAGRTIVSWSIGSLLPYETGVVSMEIEVPTSFKGERIDNSSCVFEVANAADKTAGLISIAVHPDDWFSNIAGAIGGWFSSIGSAISSAVQQAIGQELRQAASIGYTPAIIRINGGDYLHVRNGSAIVPINSGTNSGGNITGGRALVVGPSYLMSASSNHWLLNEPGGIGIAAGVINSNEISLGGIPSVAGVRPVRELLHNLRDPGLSILPSGAGNMVAAGGGNLVGNSGNTMVAAGAGNLIGLDGGSIMPISTLVAAGGGNLVGNNGNTMVAAGGGNMVAAGGGNIMVVGSASLVGNNGNTILPSGAGGLIGQDGGSMVAAGGLNLVAAGAGNIIQRGGLQFRAEDGVKLNSSTLISNISSGFIAGPGIFTAAQAANMVRNAP